MQSSLFSGDKKEMFRLTIAEQEKPLSKNQQAFNRLTARIGKLRAEIEQNGNKLRSLSAVYHTELLPAIEQLGHGKIMLAKALDAAGKTVKLPAKLRADAEDFIFELLDDAFTVVMPDAEAEALFNSVSDSSYKEVVAEDRETLKEQMEDHLYEMFGIEVDMDGFNGSPEEIADFEQKIKEQLHGAQQKKSERKKTKKQIAKEAQQQQQEEVKNKSVRSIYMSLVKLLHPDTEQDETLRKEKEEIMKQVTTAYNGNDLSTLLQLELRWVAKESGHLEKMSDDKLAVYIGVLKEQVRELEMDREMLLANPAFAEVAQWLHHSEAAAVKEMQYEKKGHLSYIKKLELHTEAVRGRDVKEAVKNCLNSLHDPFANGQYNQVVDQLMEMMMGGKKPFTR
jgi:hypothetical protein